MSIRGAISLFSPIRQKTFSDKLNNVLFGNFVATGFNGPRCCALTDRTHKQIEIVVDIERSCEQTDDTKNVHPFLELSNNSSFGRFHSRQILCRSKFLRFSAQDLLFTGTAVDGFLDEH